MQKKIAVTGGIGSGKSTVLNLIKEMGYPVYSCDDISRELWQNPAYVEKIMRCFPSLVVNGKLNKKMLSSLIFSDEKARANLNAITHPEIMERLLKQMETVQSDLVFAEVPLLFEGGFQPLFDGVIVVVRDLEDRIVSVCQRDGITREQALAKIHAQFNYDDSSTDIIIKQCGGVILKNNTSFLTLKERLAEILQDL